MERTSLDFTSSLAAPVHRSLSEPILLGGAYKKRRESVPLNRFNLASKGGAKVYRSC